MATYRNRKYLDFLRKLPCMLKIDGECSGGQTVACHSNYLRHGRGVGHKSADSYAIAGCNECHQEFDRNLHRLDRSDIYSMAVERQLAWLVENDYIGMDK